MSTLNRGVNRAAAPHRLGLVFCKTHIAASYQRECVEDAMMVDDVVSSDDDVVVSNDDGVNKDNRGKQKLKNKQALKLSRSRVQRTDRQTCYANRTMQFDSFCVSVSTSVCMCVSMACHVFVYMLSLMTEVVTEICHC